MKKIILAGASGLIGGQVMRMLVERANPERLHIVVRSKLENAPPGVIQHVGEPAIWRTALQNEGFDVAISCLGSTIRKAGSRQAFAAVDRDMVLEFADIVRNDGTKHFISVSSVGAASKSGNFYLATKGQAEEGLRNIGFDRVDILRPGLLRGDRVERRIGERLAIAASPAIDLFLNGSLKRFRSIESSAVARAIVKLSLADGAGYFIHENEAIAALAG